jgi:hypothetical protein
MKPSKIRDELLEQHRGLRSLIEQTCLATERWSCGDGPQRDARDCLICLADAVRKHNLREEELLQDVIPTVDPWGPVRAEIMKEEHVKEHEDLYVALRDAAILTGAKQTARLVVELRERMLVHMAREERDFLNEDTLRDDDVSIDSIGG